MSFWFKYRFKYASDVGLLDPNIIESCTVFYKSVCLFMLYVLENRPLDDQLVIPVAPQQIKPSDLWSSLPEWIIEDIADFILFSTQ